ncbi:MAG: tetratricopeptide repeat protein [Proteobacteria bacterium]|nr:tetratricopeptide repeat protein [Pseudomonadota bacterium]
MVLAFAASAAQNDARLDGLFTRLKSAANPIEARLVEKAIWQIWLVSNDARANRLMASGIVAMNRGDNSPALAAFDEIVKILPGFAEGWNKRATVHYLMGSHEESLGDIVRTLALEPRHFGALSGRGLVNLALGREEAALKAFEAALHIYPHLAGNKSHIKALREKLKGKEI